MIKKFIINFRYACFGFLLFPLISAVPLIPGPGMAAEIYDVDPDHSAITFRVKHMGITFVYGRFNNARGSYAFDDTVPENCFIDVRVMAADIDTGNEKRDDHLRSPDFFDVANFPDIVFQSVLVEKIQEATYRIIGHLTLHGVTRFVTVQAVKTGDISFPDGEKRIGFESTFTIQRSDYRMNTTLGGIADQVELTVSVEGVRRRR
jgi:polyisoprenoid-binding protein YceI